MTTPISRQSQINSPAQKLQCPCKSSGCSEKMSTLKASDQQVSNPQPSNPQPSTSRDTGTQINWAGVRVPQGRKAIILSDIQIKPKDKPKDELKKGECVKFKFNGADCYGVVDDFRIYAEGKQPYANELIFNVQHLNFNDLTNIGTELRIKEITKVDALRCPIEGCSYQFHKLSSLSFHYKRKHK